ncbi:PilZ domain-containing protein [Rhabdochromatium marinum]|uniref:PilZ domain-containing protein n=1 Tax=Rhabdochromatium marinum TaxID=48729 RepID=UPI00190899AD|nr:PilZ domain-containing protein [Rhabdochromatium marinum]
MKVSCGIRATVQISKDSERLMGRIVGVSNGEVLMVRVAPNAIFRDIRDNWPDLIVRFAAEGYVYGFLSSILGTLEQPAVVFVKWPQQVKSVKLRVHERVPCFLNANLHIDALHCDVAITDLSAGGCRITVAKENQEAKAALAVEQSISLVLSAGNIGSQGIRGRIKSITEDENSRCGIMFEDLNQDQQLAIDQLMDDIKALW